MMSCEKALALNALPLVVHGFFTRDGGVSGAHFSSLNCSLKVGDNVEDVIENRRRALSSIGLPYTSFFLPAIAHGYQSLVIDKTSQQEIIASTDADALITTDMDIALSVTYADCVPILIASCDGEVVAALHAGWRGIKNEVIVKTVRKIRNMVGPKAELVAAIGPAISQQGFAVSGDALNFFVDAWPRFIKHGDDVVLVHLTGIAQAQLENVGIFNIEKVGGFTDLDPVRYFSHRRDGGATGRHVAIIAKIILKK